MEASNQTQNPTQLLKAIKKVATSLGFKTDESNYQVLYVLIHCD